VTNGRKEERRSRPQDFTQNSHLPHLFHPTPRPPCAPPHTHPHIHTSHTAAERWRASASGVVTGIVTNSVPGRQAAARHTVTLHRLNTNLIITISLTLLRLHPAFPPPFPRFFPRRSIQLQAQITGNQTDGAERDRHVRRQNGCYIEVGSTRQTSWSVELRVDTSGQWNWTATQMPFNIHLQTFCVSIHCKLRVPILCSK